MKEGAGESCALFVFCRHAVAAGLGRVADETHGIDAQTRTKAIADEVSHAFTRGRKILVLTERADHIAAIEAALSGRVDNVFTLHGRMSNKQRNLVMEELDALTAETPRVLLATGKLVGEGFDHPPLDTLVLAMPISWKGSPSSTRDDCIEST